MMSSTQRRAILATLSLFLLSFVYMQEPLRADGMNDECRCESICQLLWQRCTLTGHAQDACMYGSNGFCIAYCCDVEPWECDNCD